MATIDHDNILDLRDLATLARECGEEVSDPENYDEDDRQESAETLVKLSELCAELGRATDEEDAEDIADALEALGNEFGPLIDEDYFEAYAKELVTDIGDLPEGLPSYIESNIDWSGVADDIKVDYTSLTLDGVDYYYR